MIALSQAIRHDVARLGELSQTITSDIDRLNDNVEEISVEIVQMWLNQEHKKILDWLSPPNFASKQIDVLSR